ncbi:phosphatase PAP2 family protein [Thiothrix subterranea]|uniref:Phosphatase PAP2 family protein n=1 Tax=Thiothrix subterranea TaxID=2735563 RepID=A0AA51R693_9GAMM|nr:phosphatase PAP2 family protein [Thiothrix subterranea]MDQ5769667.1 phosphatase PAP2 family protein [Thiothrix subterranea]WML88461.1 phosphatase PAP2 family protein [Thiothrix subterranea]
MNVWQRYPRIWQWFNIVVASTVVFWLSDWDLQIAQSFRRADHWLLDYFPLWKILFYDGVKIIAMVVLFGSLLAILIGSLRQQYRLRLAAIYVLLVFLLGPGLLVNTVFKDHWGRPRPVQVAELGGQERYVPPGYFVVNGEGRSFPSGHSSIGFAFVAFWFLWRERKPQWARLALAFSVTLGAVIGVTRMAAGGHFLSDVMWSAWVVLFAAWLLYYPLMRMAERDPLDKA